jgi:DNA-binding YbaB/EbfC family protein
MMNADLGKMFAQAQKMQENMEKQKAEISGMTFKGTAGGGLAEAMVNGDLMLVGLKIMPEAVDPEDVEMLEDVILAAIKDGQKKAQSERKGRLSAFTGGMDFSDLF